MVIQIPYVIYLLGGVAVRVATNPAGKALAKRLIAQGFKKQAAYKTFKNFTTATKENLVGLITKAKEVLSKGKPTSNNKKGDGGSKITTAGGRGQSALGRRVGLSKMKNYGKVGPKSTSLPKKVPKKPSGGPKSVPKSTTTSSGLAKLGRGTLIGANIMAGLGLAKVGYDAWKNRNGVTDVDVKDIKITRGEKETKAEFNNRLKKLLPKVAPSKPKPSPKVTKEYFGNRRPTGSGISSTTKKKIDETVRKVLIASRKKEGKK